MTNIRAVKIGQVRFTLVALVFSGLTLSSCAQIAGKVATIVYPALDQPWSPENAPTATTFPPSRDIRAVIGGRGEGMGCSIPRVAESMMFDTITKGGAPVTLDFRQACVFHDFCYRHGHATYGYSKSDCDFLLQEHAYRLCLQIFANELSREQCRVRARVVLLGVGLFGGKSFAHGHKSTFFEFDPFPQRANDFVVARLARHPDRPFGQMAPDSAQRNSSLWTFYFKEGWMMVRSYQHVPEPIAPATPFLREKVSVPPQVVRAPGTDRFVWLARRSLANTGVYAFAADATAEVNVASVIAQNMIHEGTENTKCTSRDKKNGVVNGYAALEFDCNTSVTKTLTINCKSGENRTLIATLSHLGRPPLSGEAQPGSIDEACDDRRFEIVLSAVHLRGEPLLSNTYRFVQNDFITGNFAAKSDLSLIAFGRGHHGNHERNTKNGEDFENVVLAVQRSLTRTGTTSTHMLRLPERLEPVAVYRADGEDRDRVIALFMRCVAGQGCKVAVRDWIPAETWRESEVSLDLAREWLRQPAHVLLSEVPGRGDWLSFSRVDSSDGDQDMDQESFAPRNVRLAHRVFRREASGWREHARACAIVDIRRQIRSNIGATLVRRYFPRDADAVAAGRCADGDKETLEKYPACRAMLRDFAARWHRSQIIPGYLYKYTPKTGVAAVERYPDVVFVYNGFPRYSVVIRPDSIADKDWTSPCSDES